MPLLRNFLLYFEYADLDKPCYILQNKSTLQLKEFCCSFATLDCVFQFLVFFFRTLIVTLFDWCSVGHCILRVLFNESRLEKCLFLFFCYIDMATFAEVTPFPRIHGNQFSRTFFCYVFRMNHSVASLLST